MPRVLRGYKEAAKSSIIAAAVEVFAAKGYHGSTMDDVSKKLGVSKGALYQYFKSKEDLLKEIQTSSRQMVREELKHAFGEHDPVEGAEIFFDKVFERFQTGLHTGFDMFSLAAYDEKLRRVLREDHEKDTKLLEEFIEEQIHKRKINTKFDKRFLTRLLIGLSLEVLLELVLGYDRTTVRRAWVDSVATIFGARQKHPA